MPNPLDLASSLARAVVDHTLDGGRIATPEVQADRRRLCNACPLFDKGNARCTDCGCCMTVKWTWASSCCPLEGPRWLAV